MCGIAGVYLKDPSIIDTDNDREQFDRFLDELLLGIEKRGRDSTGFVAASGTKIQMDKLNVPASTFIKTRRRAWLKDGTRMVLGHARLATQGLPSQMENNHPVLYNTTFVTHNGHIWNDDDVFEDLKLDRPAEVDSVAIAASLAHYGFDDARKALEMLKGGFAIAAIDPVKNPNTLLLAKGVNYPLAFYENAHILVWASEGAIIQTAFEKIMGVKPATSKIKYLKEGDVIWVRDGKIEREDAFFKAHAKPTTNWYSSYTRPSTGTTCSTTPKPNPSRGVTIVLNLRDEMKKLRANGHGRAIVFENRAQMTTEQLKLHNGKWVMCLHCQATVAEFCFIKHSEWGETCWDCLAAALLRKAQNDKPKGAKWAELSDEEFEQLEEQADLELKVIEDACDGVATETGISYRTIMWLLFCSDFVNLGNHTEQLKERLFEVYLMEESRLFEGDPTDEDTWETNSYVPKEAQTPAPPERQIEPPKETPVVMGKCDHCNRKAKHYNAGLRWCNRHFDVCYRSKCSNFPVAWDPKGKMVCHHHSRGVKGLRYLEKATA